MPLLVMPESICYQVHPRIVLAWLEKEFPLRVTPAMEAGISDHVWSVEEMVNLLEHNTAEALA